MKTRFHISLVILSAIVFVVPVTLARYVPQWFYEIDQIARRSELIVIACPVACKPCGTATNVIVTGCTTNDIEVIRFNYQVKAFPKGMNAFVPTETTFLLLSVLKGEAATNSFTMFHYTWDKDFYRTNNLSRVNPPHLVSFSDLVRDAKDITSHGLRPKYLMFLKRTKDDRLYPTSGHFDPAYSIQLIEEDRDWHH
jgi:hypothetical protein